MAPHPRQFSRLLINEPPLQVLPSLAVAVGLNEALFLQQLHYWLQKSGKQRDDRVWVYNTYDEWLAQFPFWSLRTLRRVINGLEERGIVLSTERYNTSKVDHTKWYGIDYDALDGLPVSADDVANLARPAGQPDQMDGANLARSVPETTQEINGREDEARPLSVEEIEKRDEWIRRQKRQGG